MANDEDVRSIGDLIREARKNAGWTLRELAAKVAVHYTYISDIEKDRRIPSETVLSNLAKQLNLDLDKVMAIAGKFGENVDRYLRRHPTMGVIIRRIADSDLSEKDLKKLLPKLDRLISDRPRSK
jgi:transcriptional regulator with XRE-family HTH domain